MKCKASLCTEHEIPTASAPVTMLDCGDNGAVFIDLRAGGSQRLFSSAFTRLDGGQPEGVARYDWQRRHGNAGGLCHWFCCSWFRSGTG